MRELHGSGPSTGSSVESRSNKTAAYIRSLRTSFIWLAIVLILLALSLRNEYREASQHATSRVESISRVQEEHALAAVQKSDLLMQDVLGDVRPSDMRLARGAKGPRSKYLHALLERHLKTAPGLLGALHLTNAQGEHIHSSNANVPHIDISDRSYFQYQRENANAGLVISPPLVSRTTGQWTIVLTRRINFENGSFAGTITAILEPEYFQQFYRDLNMDAHGVVAMYDKELRLIARYPNSEKYMGKTPNIYARTYIEKGVGHAVYHAVSPIDGIDRIYSFRQVGNLPLFVFAGAASEDYLAVWRRHVLEYALSLLIVGFVVIVLKLRQRQAEMALQRSSERIEMLLHSVAEGIYGVDMQGNCTFINAAGLRLLGYQDEAELLGKHMHDAIHHTRADGSAYPSAECRLYHCLKSHQDVHVDDEVFWRKDGSSFPVDYWSRPIHLDGEDGAVVTFIDITERKEILAELHASEAKLRSMYELSPLGIALTDMEGRYLEFNPAFERICGYTRAELNALDYWALTPSKYAADEARQLASLQQTGHYGPYEKEYIRKDGSLIPIQLNGMLIEGERGAKYIWSIVEDITQRKAVEKEINTLAFFDVLTRLPNRRLLHDRLDQALAASKRSGLYGALIFLDLDNFKPLNDMHGHNAGDLLLSEAARRIEGCIRETDTAARFGGDEFVVILNELSESKAESEAQARSVAEKIGVALSKPYLLAVADADAPIEYHCTASIGVVVFNHQVRQDDLLNLADMAMYEAKTNGRACVVVYQQHDAHMEQDAQGAKILHLDWHDSYNCGEPTIDSEHRRLFELANALIAAGFTREAKPQRFDAALDVLLAHVAKHFSDEEAILARYGYADLEQHAYAHKAILKHAAALRDNAAAGRVTMGELVNFLADEVVVQHLLKSDRQFYRVFNNKAQSLAE